MATSGSFERKVYDKAFELNDIVLGFSWTRTSYSLSSNTSTISYQVYFKLGSNYKTFAFNGTTVNVTIDGVKRTYSINKTVNHPGEGNPVVFVNDTITLTHDAGGSKKFSYYVGIDEDIEDVNWTLSSTGTLDTLPLPLTIKTAPNFNDTESPEITFGNAIYSYPGVVAVAISFTGGTDDIKYREVPKVYPLVFSYKFDFTDEERKILRQGVTTGSSTTVRFYVRNTIDGQHYWSYLTRTLSLVDFEPTVNPVVKDTNSTTTALTGNENVLIPGHSNAQFSIGAVARKEATVAHQTVTCGAIVKSGATGTFERVPDHKFTFYCRDSRGNMVYHPYETDYVSYFKVSCNQTVQLNLDGTVSLIVKGNYCDVNFGAQNNNLKIEHRSREAGGEWTEWGDITITLDDISGGTYALTTTMSGFDPSGTYEFQARASDKLTSADSGIDSVTLKPIFDWGKYDFNFNVPIKIEGYDLADYVVETGVEAMGSNGTWYWAKWKSGRAECYGRRNYGDMAVTETWGSLYRSEVFSQSLPSGLFIDTPEMIDIRFRGADKGGWIANHEDFAASSNETGGFILVRPASYTLKQAMISFNVIGRWK